MLKKVTKTAVNYWTLLNKLLVASVAELEPDPDQTQLSSRVYDFKVRRFVRIEKRWALALFFMLSR